VVDDAIAPHAAEERGAGALEVNGRAVSGREVSGRGRVIKEWWKREW
jgi:hypothetical protein